MPAHAELQKSHLPPLPQPPVRVNEQHKKRTYQHEGQKRLTWTPTNTILSAIMWSTSGNTAQLIRTVLNVYVAHGSASYRLIIHGQGELEHRNAKMRYKRTDRKEFVQQLARIERRQARIRRMCPQNQPGDEGCAARPEAHHTIGKTENLPENLSLFIQKHSGDPAIEVRASAIPDFFRNS
jgi:hypothetical protein